MRIYIAYDKAFTDSLPSRIKYIALASNLPDLERRLRNEQKEGAIWEAESYTEWDEDCMYIKNEKFVKVVQL